MIQLRSFLKCQNYSILLDEYILVEAKQILIINLQYHKILNLNFNILNHTKLSYHNNNIIF